MLRDPLARVCSAFKFLHSVGMEPAVRERMKQEVKTPKEWIRFDGIASCQTKMLVQRRCAENCKSLCRIWRVLELHACHCLAEACLDEALVRGGAQATPSSLNSAVLPWCAHVRVTLHTRMINAHTVDTVTPEDPMTHP